MPNRFIVVSGLPASGKPTLGRAVAAALGLPLLDKDDLLEGLFESLGIGDAEWRNRLSREADEELRRQALASAGAVVISWWRHPLASIDSGTPTEWLSSLPGKVVELHCVCSPSLAATRFVARERHAGHLDGRQTYDAVYESLERQAGLGPLGVGRVVEVDTTDGTPAVDEILRRLSQP